MPPEPETTTSTCPTCEAQFTPEPGTRRKYCSRRCRDRAHLAPHRPPIQRTCPVCEVQFTTDPNLRQIYCSPACRTEQEKRRDQARDAERARRLGEPAAHTGLARPTTARPRRRAEPVEHLAPAATRDCPHCGQPVTIVALLATPEAARPTITQPGGEVIAQRRA